MASSIDPENGGLLEPLTHRALSAAISSMTSRSVTAPRTSPVTSAASRPSRSRIAVLGIAVGESCSKASSTSLPGS